MPEERQAIRARAEAATPGPWRWGYKDGSDAGRTLVTEEESVRAWSGYVLPDIVQPAVDDPPELWENPANAAFIAAARTDIPALSDHADAQDQRIAELEVALRGSLQALGLASDFIGDPFDLVSVQRKASPLLKITIDAAIEAASRLVEDANVSG